MEASPTLRQPLRLSCLRKPPQRFEMFSTTRPWETQGQECKREEEMDTEVDRVTGRRISCDVTVSTVKPTDPALSLRRDNATQQAHIYMESHVQILSILPIYSSLFSHKHTPHLYVCLEVEQVNLLPVAAI